LTAIFWAIGAMLVVIIIYDQLLFRPLVAWADRFRFDQENIEDPPESWLLTVIRRSELLDTVAVPFKTMLRWSYRLTPPTALRLPGRSTPFSSRAADFAWAGMLVAICAYALWRVYEFVAGNVSGSEVLHVFMLGFLTMVRVMVLIAIASVIWTPIGIYVGLRPKVAHFVQPIAQFLAAFPANLLFPVAVYLVVTFSLDPDIWLSPLMVLGTQWYILFNVIAGASGLPRELRDAGANFQVRGWLWWRKIALPGVFPFYVTGAITASGGSWNAAMLAEYVTWGTKTLHAQGLGDYLQKATNAGNFQHIVLGIAVMSVLVTIINRTFWRPLYQYAERKYKLT
jgi:NitT/TauT family transport system permease protein